MYGTNSNNRKKWNCICFLQIKIILNMLNLLRHLPKHLNFIETKHSGNWKMHTTSFTYLVVKCLALCSFETDWFF